MYAVDLISSDVPTLSPKDKVSDILSLMNDLQWSNLPLVEDKQYLGLVDEMQLEDAPKEHLLLSELAVPVFKPSIDEKVHFFEALKIMGNYQLHILPVVDKFTNYSGSITIRRLLTEVSRFNSFHLNGAIIILKVEPPDYFLSEIARIAELEEVVLLGVHTLTDAVSGTIEVLLKTNYKNLNGFVSSLQQANYEVVNRFDEVEDAERLQENYDHLMNFIKM